MWETSHIRIEKRQAIDWKYPGEINQVENILRNAVSQHHLKIRDECGSQGSMTLGFPEPGTLGFHGSVTSGMDCRAVSRAAMERWCQCRCTNSWEAVVAAAGAGGSVVVWLSIGICSLPAPGIAAGHYSWAQTQETPRVRIECFRAGLWWGGREGGWMPWNPLPKAAKGRDLGGQGILNLTLSPSRTQ